MLSSTRRLVSSLALVGAIVACLAAPLAASAATTRYASPGGTGASPCLATAPCSIETALSSTEGLANGDTVLLAPGTYTPSGQLKVLRFNVTVEAEPGKAAPLIDVAGTRGFVLENEGTVRDLRIHATTATTIAFQAGRPGSVVERVESTGDPAVACELGSVTVRDTLCATFAANGEGIGTSISGPLGTGFEPLLYNVTAIGGRVGIDAFANEESVVKVKAFNTIIRGGELDIEAYSGAAESHVEIELSHSNFETTNPLGPGAIAISAPTANGNQGAAPLFVDKAGGDYREAASSPTRLAGDLATVLPGETDLAGNPRTTNCAGTVGIDIGAYQYECPTPPPATVPPVVNPPDNRVPCACVGEGQPRPGLSNLALKPAKFTVTGKAPKGTTVSFTLSAAASVKLEILGTKRPKGGKPKTVTVGSLPVVKGKAGANSVRFNGRLGGKPLDPGTYTLRAVASAARISSRPVSRSFTVLIP